MKTEGIKSDKWTAIMSVVITSIYIKFKAWYLGELDPLQPCITTLYQFFLICIYFLKYISIGQRDKSSLPTQPAEQT